VPQDQFRLVDHPAATDIDHLCRILEANDLFLGGKAPSGKISMGVSATLTDSSDCDVALISSAPGEDHGMRIGDVDEVALRVDGPDLIGVAGVRLPDDDVTAIVLVLACVNGKPLVLSAPDQEPLSDVVPEATMS